MVTALNEKSVYISLIFSQDPLGLCVCLKEKSASASWTLPPTWVPGVLEADCLMCTEARRSELKRDRTSAQFNPDWRSGSQMRSSDWRMSCCCYLERKKNKPSACRKRCVWTERGREEEEEEGRGLRWPPDLLSLHEAGTLQVRCFSSTWCCKKYSS